MIWKFEVKNRRKILITVCLHMLMRAMIITYKERHVNHDRYIIQLFLSANRNVGRILGRDNWIDICWEAIVNQLFESESLSDDTHTRDIIIIVTVRFYDEDTLFEYGNVLRDEFLLYYLSAKTCAKEISIFAHVLQSLVLSFKEDQQIGSLIARRL